jgi:hypothetical protein
MLALHPNTAVQKRDLHIGGTGAMPFGGGLAAIKYPIREVEDSWALRVRDVAAQTDDALRSSPWAALAVVAVAGIAAGFLLSRRF